MRRLLMFAALAASAIGAEHAQHTDAFGPGFGAFLDHARTNATFAHLATRATTPGALVSAQLPRRRRRRQQGHAAGQWGARGVADQGYVVWLPCSVCPLSAVAAGANPHPK